MATSRESHNLSSSHPRAIPLRWHLVLLVVGTMLPVVLFAGTVVQRLAYQERASSERRILLAAHNLAETVEKELSSTSTTLAAMAASERLEARNLEAFYNEARRVAATQPTWLTVILLAPDGRQLINIAYPFGKSLPPVNEPESLRQIIQTRRPLVGNLAQGRINKQWAFPVRVPVIRKGKLLYVLTAVMTPQSLSGIVAPQMPGGEEWARTVVDAKGIIVARSRAPERFVGVRGTPSFLARISQSEEGLYRDTTLDGAQVYLAFSRVPNSRWTASIAIPIAVLEGPGRRALAWIGGIGLVLLLASSAGALILSRQITGAIQTATLASEALVKGEVPSVPPTSIREVALLGNALDSSAKLLAQRERERDENLARAEAARAEAETASHLKDEFLITVSHELRTPLNAILGWASLLKAGQLDAATGQRAIDVIERNSRSLSQLVDDLLDMSRIISGKLRLEAQPVDLAAVITGAVDSVRPAAEAKSIELGLRIETVCPVAGDQSRLQQVVWNLLSNAVKFTPKDGQIDVALEQHDGQALITVRDSGVGIPQEFLPNVFDRFRQADGSTTRKFGGLGLGLAIVRQLVELHGGTVAVNSEGEGKGATFSVKIPLNAAQREENRAFLDGKPPSADGVAPLPGNDQALQGTRVLVVDDDLDARTLIFTVLTQQGAEVRACNSASEAFIELQTWKPSVILSDIGMPQQDGYDFIRRVRDGESQSGQKIPAAALTALARAEDRAKALASGYQMHIPKPVDPATLIHAIRTLLEEKIP